MEEYLWIPGRGIDLTALQRMRSQFPKPSKPMGEAWFMGEERRMFTVLLPHLNDISTFDMQTPLTEIASGFSCFGPLEEWSDWYLEWPSSIAALSYLEDELGKIPDEFRDLFIATTKN